MSGKKGMKHYLESYKEQVRQDYGAGTSMRSVSRKYGISMYSVESLCGKRPEVNLRQTAPLKKGRPSAEKSIEDYKQENKRLKMEVELLRGFLSLTERK